MKPQRKKQRLKSSKNQSENLDDEEALFVSKHKKGTGKYKGKLPLKCFNCRRIGHFSLKCSYQKQDESDHEESCCHKGKKKFKKKKEELLFQGIECR